ncbi:hypothetical protein [Radiobacillus deserti]|uniref:Uncharacterized protein n=1 Tax=Radiobacillus deserti TaxID=2594883 RepID=A0A516KIR6_9BACI|nr:hypothetical protein [Radiobacillus deserti]QDP41246.1 hypothetical protein FN924_14280 [Radiobacillus deserti]
MHKLIYLLHSNGSMQKRDIIQSMNWTLEQFNDETKQLKENNWLLELAPNLFVITAQARQALKTLTEQKEQLIQQEQMDQKQRSDPLKKNSLARLNERVKELEVELRIANTKIVSLTQENEKLKFNYKQKVSSMKRSSTITHQLVPRLGMWLDLGQAEHER